VQFEPAHKIDSYVSRGLVTFHHNQFENIFRGIGEDAAGLDLGKGFELPGDTLIWDTADCLHLPGTFAPDHDLPKRTTQVPRFKTKSVEETV
jgi:hypothetical protein